MEDLNAAALSVLKELQRIGVTAPGEVTPTEKHIRRKGAPLTATGPVTTPSGRVYHPRALVDHHDVAALRKCREAGVYVLLNGRPGTGKTSLVEAAFGDDLITVTGNEDTEVADFVGGWTQNSSGLYEFQDGPLTVAMEQGKVLFIDDATLISPKVLACVYPAMDGRRRIDIPNPRRAVVARDGFYVVAAHNPGVHGAVLTEALASRFFLHVNVPSDYDLARSLGINRQAVKVAENLAAKQLTGEVSWAPQFRELVAFAKIEESLGEEVAFANWLGICDPEDQPVVVAVMKAVTGKVFSVLSIGRQV